MTPCERRPAKTEWLDLPLALSFLGATPQSSLWDDQLIFRLTHLV